MNKKKPIRARDIFRKWCLSQGGKDQFKCHFSDKVFVAERINAYVTICEWGKKRKKKK